MNINFLKEDFERIVFFDIETTTKVRTYEELTPKEQELYCKRLRLRFKDDLERVGGDCSKLFAEKAALTTEFGKVLCISLGWYDGDEFETRTITDEDESNIIKKFANFVRNKFGNDKTFGYLCGQNVRAFDLPYLMRKMVAYDIMIPEFINPSWKKPWDMETIIDTKDIMGFGSQMFREVTLTDNLYLLGIEEYEDVKGEDVYMSYWTKGTVDDIVKHCESDIFVTAQLFKKALYCF